MNKIAPAFIKAKRAFSPALKDKTNPAFRSKYADLGACLEAVNDALLDNGIAVYQETEKDDSGVTVETVFLHESGESMRYGKLHVPAVKSDPQGYGSALTYARRYSLMAACGIAPEDDDGNAASRPRAEQNYRASPAAEIANGWAATADEQRLSELQELALELIESFAKNNGLAAVRMFYGLTDNDEKVYVWNLLKTESKLRTFLKANKPTLNGAQQAEIYRTAESKAA